MFDLRYWPIRILPMIRGASAKVREKVWKVFPVGPAPCRWGLLHPMPRSAPVRWAGEDLVMARALPVWTKRPGEALSSPRWRLDWSRW